MVIISTDREEPVYAGIHPDNSDKSYSPDILPGTKTQTII